MDVEQKQKINRCHHRYETITGETLTQSFFTASVGQE